MLEIGASAWQGSGPVTCDLCHLNVSTQRPHPQIILCCRWFEILFFFLHSALLLFYEKAYFKSPSK